MKPKPALSRLLSVGSIIADVRIDVANLPPRGGDVLGSEASVSPGGGFNILAAAARNGLKAAFAGQHGTGPYGECIREALRAEGIEALRLPNRAGDSGFCVVLVEPDGERTFVTSPGVEARSGTGDLVGLGVGIGDGVFVSGYDLCYPDLAPVIASWLAGLSPQILVTLDPGPLVADIPPEIMVAVCARVDILTLNRREAGLLAGVEDPAGAADHIRHCLRPEALLIIRDGPAGCWLYGGGLAVEGRHVPAPVVRMVDSTGAGDAHTGVFLASVAAGQDIVEAARRANAAAAFAVTLKGPATAPRKEELDAFLAA